MKQTIDHWSLKENPGIGMIKIRTLKDETNQLETLKETHGDTLGVRIIILSACNNLLFSKAHAHVRLNALSAGLSPGSKNVWRLKPKSVHILDLCDPAKHQLC